MSDGLTAERLRSLLNYDPETGVFTWRVRARQQTHEGSIAGYMGKYVQIGIDGKTYTGHRLAWLYMIGEWPPFEVDHEDTNGTNNAWRNLRPADSAQNKHNARRRSDNTSGFKGVCLHKPSGLYRGDIQCRGKRYSTLYYGRPEEAAAALKTIRATLHGEFARHG